MLRGEFLMTGSGPAVIGHSMMAEFSEIPQAIETRFGRVEVNPRQAVHFRSGLLGMPDKVNYCLTHFPSEKMARFTLLQSLDDPALSFITLPVAMDNPIIERADLEQAAQDMDMATGDVALLLIVTVHRESGLATLSVNARAPLLLSVTQKTAAQYVFANTKYLIRQPLAL